MDQSESQQERREGERKKQTDREKEKEEEKRERGSKLTDYATASDIEVTSGLKKQVNLHFDSQPSVSLRYTQASVSLSYLEPVELFFHSQWSAKPHCCYIFLPPPLYFVLVLQHNTDWPRTCLIKTAKQVFQDGEKRKLFLCWNAKLLLFQPQPNGRLRVPQLLFCSDEQILLELSIFSFLGGQEVGTRLAR